MAKGKKRSKSSFSTIGKLYPLGSAEPQGFTAAGIHYYKLGFSAQAGLHFSVLDGSGYFSLTNTKDQYADLKRLIHENRMGQPTTLPRLPFITKPRAPGMIVYSSCYVVIELDSSVNWRFLSGKSAIMIGTNYVPDTGGGVGANPETAYFALNHIDTDGLTTAYYDYDGKDHQCGIAPTSERTCQLVHFAVNPRQFSKPAGTAPSTNADQFNLYIEIDHGMGEFLTITIDPDIKNEGGSNPYDFKPDSITLNEIFRDLKRPSRKPKSAASSKKNKARSRKPGPRS